MGTGASSLTVALDAADLAKLGTKGLILVSYESASGGVNAWSFPVKQG